MITKITSQATESEYRPNFFKLNLSRSFIGIAFSWTLFIALLSVWEERQAHFIALELASTDVRSTFNKDLAYRRWAARHGGVYVPITEETPPSPYLAHIPERDINTPSGKRLTLMNPAYMTRQVHDLSKEQYGIRGHITSLNPLRLENAPDAWEAKVLKTFETAAKEVSSLEMIGNELYMRMMRPMITEAGCLKCHGHQGYKIGDVRGGISVSVPWKPYHDVTRGQLHDIYLGLSGVWMTGVVGLWFMQRRIQWSILLRKQAEEALRERNQFIESILDLSPDVLYIYDLVDRRNVYVNEGIQRILGYSTEEVQQMGDQLLVILMHPEDLSAYLREILPRYFQVKDNELILHQYRMKHKNGEWYWLDCSELVYNREPDGTPRQLLGVVHDITGQKQAEDRLQQSLREKEVMLKEIHHRVKNNLQVIYSLLNLQSKTIADPLVRAMFAESQNRIQSMTLIHEKLYHSKDTANIDFKEYLQSLVLSIASTYKRFDIEISLEMEPIVFDVNVGIPCGLIVNELVSNCLKHAFPGNRQGTITLGINRDSEGNNIMKVSDDGIGFPEKIDFRNTTSLGMQLVLVLTGQIHGTIEIMKDAGTTFRITFPGGVKGNE